MAEMNQIERKTNVAKLALAAGMMSKNRLDANHPHYMFCGARSPIFIPINSAMSDNDLRGYLLNIAHTADLDVELDVAGNFDADIAEIEEGLVANLQSHPATLAIAQKCINIFKEDVESTTNQELKNISESALAQANALLDRAKEVEGSRSYGA